MHSLRREMLRKVGGFAALCAILLLSFAPLISHALEYERGDVPGAALCAASASAGQPVSHDGALAHLKACGYCDLVTHAPTPPLLPRNTASTAHTPETFVDALRSAAPRDTFRPHAQPRAPPAFA